MSTIKRNNSGQSGKELKDLKDAFAFFDNFNTGEINPSELKEAMISTGLSDKNSAIFDMIKELTKKGTAINFDTFVEAVNKRAGDRKTMDGLRKMYDLFINDSENKTITINTLSKMTKDLKIDMEPKKDGGIVEFSGPVYRSNPK